MQRGALASLSAPGLPCWPAPRQLGSQRARSSASPSSSRSASSVSIMSSTVYGRGPTSGSTSFTYSSKALLMKVRSRVFRRPQTAPWTIRSTTCWIWAGVGASSRPTAATCRQTAAGHSRSAAMFSQEFVSGVCRGASARPRRMFWRSRVQVPAQSCPVERLDVSSRALRRRERPAPRGASAMALSSYCPKTRGKSNSRTVRRKPCSQVA